jgi:hypothetical protein
VVLPELGPRVRATAPLVEDAERRPVRGRRQDCARGDVDPETDDARRVDPGRSQRRGHATLDDLEVVTWVLQGPVDAETGTRAWQLVLDDAVGIADLLDRQLLPTDEVEHEDPP